MTPERVKWEDATSISRCITGNQWKSEGEKTKESFNQKGFIENGENPKIKQGNLPRTSLKENIPLKLRELFNNIHQKRDLAAPELTWKLLLREDWKSV